MKIRIAVVTTSAGGYACGTIRKGSPRWSELEEAAMTAGELDDHYRGEGTLAFRRSIVTADVPVPTSVFPPDVVAGVVEEDAT